MEPISLPGGAWVLVGDGRKALLLQNAGTPQRVRLVTERVLQQDNPPSHDQGTDRPGRHPGPAGAGRSAMEETDWHQLSEDRFAKTMAELLRRAVQAGRVGQLMLVAPPKTLGNLRIALHEDVAKRVIGELPKDLTSHPIAEMERLLSRHP